MPHWAGKSNQAQACAGPQLSAADSAEKPAELLEFLDMAERAYVGAPGSRAKLVKMMGDVLKRQEKNIS